MGKKEGVGKYRFNDGRIYEGQWRDGKQDGKGKMIYPDGVALDGTWK